MQSLIETLINFDASLALRDSEGTEHLYFGRGVSDLYRLLTQQPELLHDATIADKVVGRGAAALMILGGVKQLHALTLSEQAKSFLDESNVDYTYGELVTAIINRTGTGLCPVEQLTSQCKTPQETLPLIESFINSLPR